MVPSEVPDGAQTANHFNHGTVVRGMRVDELDLPDAVIDALEGAGFRELHPPQAEAIPLALEGGNLVAAIPTASGKSLIGYCPALRTLHRKEGKVLYIVPLRALASEKAEDFRRFSGLGFSVHMSTGDLDSDDRGLDRADIVVATAEKADSMIRHGSPWMEDVRLVIADEIHMIHDPGRGPNLEVALTKLMRRNPDLQIIALSATISNSDDLAGWLHAALVRSDWRPVPLREGVFLSGSITFDDRTVREVPERGDAVSSLVMQSVDDGGQCLVFVNSRRSTEAEAVRLAGLLKKTAGRTLPEPEASLLEGDSETTATGRKLASCVACGAAFHNAGLTYRQRRYVEDSFKAGLIKVIVATPTLAAGINLPARRVVVRDAHRYESSGNVPISVMEVKQMCGRAGRPGYDPYGEAVLVAKTENEYDHLMWDYVDHDTERITSKLFGESVLRSHILGLIATGDADSEGSVVDFMRDTFFGHTSSLFGVETVVEEVVDFLDREGMVRRQGDRVVILPFGRRVSDLYIDPVTASMLRDAVMRIDDSTPAMPMLIAAAMTPDVLGMFPKKGDQSRLKGEEEAWSERLLLDPDEVEDYDREYFLSDLKTAIVVNDWMEEVPEETITDSLSIGPGDIRSRVDRMDWIVYAMSEIAYIFNPDAVRRIKPLSVRIRYGVKEELSGLVSLRGIGRSRARTLFEAGYRTVEDIAMAQESVLAAMPRIGPALARSMKEQTGGGPADMFAGMSPSEEEALIEEMAAAYGEASDPAPAEGQPGTSENEKEKKDEGAGPHQASLFDFRSLRQDPLHVLDGVAALYGRGAVVDDGVGVLQAVAGADAHHALVPVHDAHLAELPEPGDGCGGGGLHADALPPAKELLGADDLGVGDGLRHTAGGVDGPQGLPAADGVADPDGRGHGLGVLLGHEVLLVLPERRRHGAGPLGLDAGEHGDLVDPSHLLELGDRLVHRPDVGGVAHGQDDPVGDVVLQLVHDLEEHGLLALRPVGVDGVQQVQLPLLGHPPGQGQGVVEVPVDGQHLGSEEQGLGQLAHGHLPGREEHGALHPRLGGVGGQRGGGVAGGGAANHLGPQLAGVGDPDGHAPVLEGPCGVQTLELYVGLPDADLGGQRLRGVQGGPALLDGDLVRGVHGHEGGVPPDPDGLLAEVLGPHLLDGLQVHLDGQETAAFGAGVDERVVDLGSAIPAYDFVRCHFRSSCNRSRAP